VVYKKLTNLKLFEIMVNDLNINQEFLGFDVFEMSNKEWTINIIKTAKPEHEIF